MTYLKYKLNEQNQVFRLLYVILPKSKDLYATYLKANKPPSIWDLHLVTTKHVRQ